MLFEGFELLNSAPVIRCPRNAHSQHHDGYDYDEIPGLSHHTYLLGMFAFPRITRRSLCAYRLFSLAHGAGHAGWPAMVPLVGYGRFWWYCAARSCASCACAAMDAAV